MLSEPVRVLEPIFVIGFVLVRLSQGVSARKSKDQSTKIKAPSSNRIIPLATHASHRPVMLSHRRRAAHQLDTVLNQRGPQALREECGAGVMRR